MKLRAALALLGALLLVGPAQAQRVVVPVAQGQAVANFNNPGEELIGWTSTGLTQVDSDAAANNPGTPVILGTASGALCKGVTIVMGYPGGNSGQNISLDISFDGGSTYKISGVYMKPALSASKFELYLPLNVQTTNTANAVRARIQAASTTSDFLQVGIVCHLNNDNNARPLWNNMVSETVSLSGETAPNASGTAITFGTGAGSYVAIDASASQTFGAIIPMFGNFSATANEMGRVDFTLENNGGTPGTGTLIASRAIQRFNSNPTTTWGFGPPIYRTISSTQQLSAAANAPTSGGTVRVGYLGFY